MATNSPPIHKIDSLEIDQNLGLQHKIWTYQRWGSVLLFFFIVASILGLLGGSGPLSRTQVQSASNNLTVYYERLLHKQAPTEVTVKINNLAAESPSVDLYVSTQYLDAFQIENILPEPAAVITEDDRIRYTFSLEGARQLNVAFYMVTQKMGSVRGQFSFTGDPEIEVSHFILP